MENEQHWGNKLMHNNFHNRGINSQVCHKCSSFTPQPHNSTTQMRRGKRLPAVTKLPTLAGVMIIRKGEEKRADNLPAFRLRTNCDMYKEHNSKKKNNKKTRVVSLEYILHTMN